MSNPSETEPSLRTRGRRFLDAPTALASKAFAWFIQILIFASLIEFAFETQPGLSADAWRVLHGIELFTVIIFTVEYLARLRSVERPLLHYQHPVLR